MPRVEISPDKGREIVGVLSAALAVICGASLASFDPADPSFLRQVSGGAPTHNWIGGFGAEIAAAGFNLLGVTCLLIPLLLAVAAWRRLRPKVRPTVVGRGAGAGLMLLSLPALLQLLLPALPWRGESIDSGGALGVVLSSALAQRMNFAGALVLLLALCIVGVALLIQTSLGDLLTRWRRRFAGALDQWRLARARRTERKEKERSRNRVVVKHLQRVAEEKQERLDKLAGVAAGRRPAAEPPSDEVALPPPGGRLDLPMRGAERPPERPGDRPVTVRRVSAPSSSGAGATTSAPASPALPAALPAAGEAPARKEKQKEFGFVETQTESELPPLNLLQLENEKPPIDEDELVRLGEAIRSRCHEFGVEGTIEGIGPGPVITVFEFQPAPGVKVSQIVNLQDDLALALKAESVRIDRIPGRSTLGVEVPNPRRGMIRLGAMLATDAFRRSPSLLSLAIGMTIHGEPYYADLATMPHLLVAGATGSGKSIGLQSLITSILYKATRDQVQFIFIDPKRIELGVYADIPHLKTEVVVEPKKAANALRWAVAEMERRYKLLAEVHVRSIDFYNRAIRDPEVRKRLELTDTEGPVRESDLKPLPYYVIIIDELADLMMVAAAEVENLDRAARPDGARGRHPPDRRDAAAVGRRSHRHDQGQLPLPAVVRDREPPRLADDPRRRRRREAPRQGRHALPAAGQQPADPPPRSVHLGAGDGRAGALAEETGQAHPRPGGARRAGGERQRGRCRPDRRRSFRPGRAARRAGAPGLGELPAAPHAGRLLARRPPHRHDGARRAPGSRPGQQAARSPRSPELLHRSRRDPRPVGVFTPEAGSVSSPSAVRGAGVTRSAIR